MVVFAHSLLSLPLLLAAASGAPGAPDPAPAPAPTAPAALFGATIDDPVLLGPKRQYQIARRAAPVNWEALRQFCSFGPGQAGTRLRLELTDAAHTVTARTVTASRPLFRADSLEWNGTPEGDPAGRARLSGIGVCGDDRTRWALSGSLRWKGQDFRIEPRPRGTVLISQVDLVAGTSPLHPDTRPPAGFPPRPLPGPLPRPGALPHRP